jgi:hypothetical protein
MRAIRPPHASRFVGRDQPAARPHRALRRTARIDRAALAMKLVPARFTGWLLEGDVGQQLAAQRAVTTTPGARRFEVERDGVAGGGQLHDLGFRFKATVKDRVGPRSTPA